MEKTTMFLTGCAKATLFTALLTLAALAPATVQAQPTDTPSTVDATPKGTIGLGLIGAELGFVVPTLAGLDDTWSLITFPVLGAAGGAVAGYFAIDEPGKSEAAVATLAVGAALILPAVVLTLTATAYDPEDVDEFEEDKEKRKKAKGKANIEFTSNRQHKHRRTKRARTFARAGSGLLRKGEGANWALSAPSVTIAQTFNTKEQHVLGTKQVMVYGLPLATGVF